MLIFLAYLTRFFLLLALFFTPGHLPATDLVPADASLTEVSLLPHARIIKNPDCDLAMPELLQLPYRQLSPDQKLVSFGFSETPYLFLISLHNPQVQPLQRLLLVHPTWLNHVEVTLISPDGSKQTFSGGDFLPFNQRGISHQNINFTLTLPPGSSQLLVRTQTNDPYLVQLTLWEQGAFFKADANLKLFLGLIYGVLLAMLLYNLVLFASVHDRVYAAYVLYLVFFLLMHSTYNGHLFHLLWPDSPGWSNWAHSIFIYLFVISGLLFTIIFLELRSKMLKLYRRARGLGLAIGASFFLTALGGYGLHVQTSIFWVFIYAPSVLILGLWSLLAGNRAARYFLPAAIAGFIGSFITALTVSGFISYSFAKYHAVDFGMLIDAILLSLALADRLRLARNEAEEAKGKLLSVTQSYAQNLEKEIAGRTLQLKKLNSRLKELSFHDALTGVGNRRKLDEYLKKEWQRHLRNHSSFSFLICDVDFFKQYNDHFGHQAGDDCLKKIANTLQKVVSRPADLIARFGGEEFAIVLPETDLAGALHVAEEIRSQVQALNINHPYSRHSGQLTLSIGVASTVPDKTGSFDILIKKADSALYRAKKSGRNKIVY